MTTSVKELKEYLDKFDDDMKVWVLNDDDGHTNFLEMEIPQDLEAQGHRLFIGYRD